tara:strand:- start:318 stop:524 length:207 start_codon:yes stop_codon:yes gene_type:complete
MKESNIVWRLCELWLLLFLAVLDRRRAVRSEPAVESKEKRDNHPSKCGNKPCQHNDKVAEKIALIIYH